MRFSRIVLLTNETHPVDYVVLLDSLQQIRLWLRFRVPSPVGMVYAGLVGYGLAWLICSTLCCIPDGIAVHYKFMSPPVCSHILYLVAGLCVWTMYTQYIP